MPWSNGKPEVSIVIPVYRRSGTVEELADFELFCEKSPLHIQLILVDDGCGSSIAQKLFDFAASHAAVTYIKHDENKGKGRAIADGVAAAEAPFVVFSDSEISYELNLVHDMVHRFVHEPRVHFIVGSRRHPDSDIRRNHGVPRRLMSWMFNRAARLVVGLPFSDVQCGIKGFRTDAARLLFSDLIVSRFAFDVELFLRAKKYGLKFEELPVVYRHDRGNIVRVMRSTFHMVNDLWRLYVRYRREAR